MPIIFLLLFLNSFTVRAQDLDGRLKSLEIRAASDTAAVTSIINLGITLRESDPSAALQTIQKAKKFAEKLKHIDGIVFSVHQIAEIKSSMGEIEAAIGMVDSTLKTYSNDLDNSQRVTLQIVKASLYNDNRDGQKALKLFSEIEKYVKDSLQFATFYANRGNSYHSIGEYQSALKDYMRALEIFLKKGVTDRAAVINLNFGLVYYSLSEFPKSLQYYLNAITLAEKLSDVELLGQCYSNLGATYEKMDSLDQAVTFYEKGLEIGKKQQNPLRIAQNLMNIGTIYKRQRKFNLALSQFEKSLEICYQQNITYGIMLSYINFGSTYFDSEDYRKSIVNFDSALVYAALMRLPSEEMSINLSLSEAHEKLGNYKEALIYHKRGVQLQDSLFTIEKQKAILEITTRYENEKKEKQIADQEFTITLYIIAFVMSVLLLGSLAAFLFYRNRKLRVIYLQNIREIHQGYTHIQEKSTLEESFPEEEKGVETSVLYNKIIDSLREKKQWLDPDFNINDLAKDLMTNRTYISAAIKKGASTNFNNLIGSFRILEAKKLIIESSNKPENMDEIMMKSGFRNRGTFNIAFHKHTGMSPGQFKGFTRLNSINDGDPLNQ